MHDKQQKVFKIYNLNLLFNRTSRTMKVSSTTIVIYLESTYASIVDVDRRDIF